MSMIVLVFSDPGLNAPESCLMHATAAPIYSTGLLQQFYTRNLDLLNRHSLKITFPNSSESKE